MLSEHRQYLLLPGYWPYQALPLGQKHELPYFLHMSLLFLYLDFLDCLFLKFLPPETIPIINMAATIITTAPYTIQGILLRFSDVLKPSCQAPGISCFYLRHLLQNIFLLHFSHAQGHTKYWLYKQMDLSHQNFSRMITNETSSIRSENLDKLSTILNCPVGE